MARSSLYGVLSQIRLIISDPWGTDEAFDDDELQVFADANRTDVYYQSLRSLPTIAPGGAITYLEWAAGGGWWESDAVLVDGSYNVLTPASSDWQRGRWTFATSQTAVLIRGARYDVYGAAAEAVEAWIAKLAREYDFSADGASFKRSQQVDGLRKLLARLQTLSGGGMTTIPMVRTDVLP